MKFKDLTKFEISCLSLFLFLCCVAFIVEKLLQSIYFISFSDKYLSFVNFQDSRHVVQNYFSIWLNDKDSSIWGKKNFKNDQHDKDFCNLATNYRFTETHETNYLSLDPLSIVLNEKLFYSQWTLLKRVFQDVKFINRRKVNVSGISSS